MEYCERGDLDAHLENRRENGHPPLPETEVQGIARQVVQGICYMHRKKFAHRDLKPSNILIKPSPPGVWKVKIGDLGLSKQVGIETIPSTIHGTKDFMPPAISGPWV
ncbi:kinase-like domain-containing protein [Annulohypoxylon nitens]|nr:kinase-like domain-containing protein [Annulohypoxylon nitens]